MEDAHNGENRPCHQFWLQLDQVQLVDLESGEGLASGLVEKIGEPVDGHYKHEYNGEKHELEERFTTTSRA